ncbi:hypothetical protein X773_04010 [Mesorhizobium sp. LSJC285A00]|jgi:hypothetical protein|nr:hypothetical protein X773_04010 [Mesorhizobium sp. LSJC285A00]ESX28267.1 hypothetical protein X767_01945 [Mesorhizobium sp. LSJC264A00]ESX45900.1 hypothetical protein X762_22740 [Mesorhizobium sp. LSHC426A00]ESX55066.1 hypothetical protein X761_16380 [Mesorhizobium sp. LSHC424B00]ESX69333.1 hypothetical protein X758_21190 [Mesorhizobium sp. LSHC416B00]ESX99700.1 hypothetical protein X755_10525 [Mesorhizobium sp. LNJC405B00]ESZ08366.1 hypothetical protein X736_08170 [Mesorhizobium sp. L2C08
MTDIRNNFVGIKSPNPFWLASVKPTRLINRALR